MRGLTSVVVLLSVLLSVLLASCYREGPVLFFRTADPNFSVGFRLLDPPVVAEEEVGEVLPDPTPTPPAIVVKGNISASGEKIYHVPGQANYETVKIDEAAGEQFFDSEEAALAAGWRKALR